MSKPTTPSTATTATSSKFLTLVFLLPVTLATILSRAFLDVMDREFALDLWKQSHHGNTVFSFLSFLSLGVVSMNYRPDHFLYGHQGTRYAQLCAVAFLTNAYQSYALATAPSSSSLEAYSGSLAEAAVVPTIGIVVFNVAFGLFAWPLRIADENSYPINEGEKFFVVVAMIASAGMIPALFL